MVLNRLAFTELLGPLREVLDRNLGVRVIQSVPLLRRLSPSEADRVLSMFESVTYTAGQSLLKVGQTYSTFFVVKSGTVHITKGSDAGKWLYSNWRDVKVHEWSYICVAEDMAAGGYFGEQALAKDAVSDCTVTAVDTVDCFVLDRRRIEREIGLLSVSALFLKY